MIRFGGYLCSMKIINLAIIEDDPVVLESLQTYFGNNPQFLLTSVTTSVEEFISLTDSNTQSKPDVLLLDIQLPGMSGIEGIPTIRQRLPEVDIIMLTTFEDSEKIFAALCAGACSYLTKQTSLLQIREAVLTVSRGGSFMSPSIARKVVEHFSPKPKKARHNLTDRQLEIVQGIVDGLSYKMIAARHDISIDTVRTHIMHIYRLLNINSKGELIKLSLKGEV